MKKRSNKNSSRVNSKYLSSGDINKLYKFIESMNMYDENFSSKPDSKKLEVLDDIGAYGRVGMALEEKLGRECKISDLDGIITNGDKIAILEFKENGKTIPWGQERMFRAIAANDIETTVIFHEGDDLSNAVSYRSYRKVGDAIEINTGKYTKENLIKYISDFHKGYKENSLKTVEIDNNTELKDVPVTKFQYKPNEFNQLSHSTPVKYENITQEQIRQAENYCKRMKEHSEIRHPLSMLDDISNIRKFNRWVNYSNNVKKDAVVNLNGILEVNGKFSILEPVREGESLARNKEEMLKAFAARGIDSYVGIYDKNDPQIIKSFQIYSFDKELDAVTVTKKLPCTMEQYIDVLSDKAYELDNDMNINKNMYSIKDEKLIFAPDIIENGNLKTFKKNFDSVKDDLNKLDDLIKTLSQKESDLNELSK